MQANQANVTFDTHKAVKALKSSGFDEKQAETVVETIDTAVNETVATKSDLALLAAKLATKEELGTLANKMATKDDIKDMATKDDIKDMATKSDLKALAKTVKAEIASLETRMMRMMLLQTLVLVSTLGALIFAVVKLL